MKTINVTPLGTTATFGEDIKGEIVGVCIYKTHVEYQVRWWKEHERKHLWLKEDEIKIKSETKTQIGFVK